MNLEATMREALVDRPDVAALACMDGSAGLVLGMYVQGDVPHDLVEMAALAGPQLDADGAGDDATVESEPWVHAFARVPNRPDIVVIGVAQRGTNVTLLRAWLGEVAGQVGRAS